MNNDGAVLSEFAIPAHGEDSAGERLQYFLIRESIAISSLLYDAPVFFTGDELELLRNSGSILYSYYTLYPKDVEGFWLVESLGRFLSKEIEKSKKIIDIEKFLFVSHIPSPFFLSRSHRTKIRKAIENLSSHHAEKQVAIMISSFDNLLIILDRLEDRVYDSFLHYFTSSVSKQEKNRSVAIAAYRDILRYLIKVENRIPLSVLSSQMRGVEAFTGVIKRLYPIQEDDEMGIDESTAASFLTRYEEGTRSLSWGFELKEKTNSDPRRKPNETKVKQRTYAPVGFGELKTLDTEDIVTTPLSDFYLHYIKTIQSPDDEISERAKSSIPYLFFFKYHKQSKMGLSKEMENSKQKDMLLQLRIISGEYQKLERVKEELTFGTLIDYNAKYIAESLKIEFTNRLIHLFENKNFLMKEKKEQLLYIMVVLRTLIREKKEQIPTIGDKYYANIRIEKMSEYISPILSEGFRLFYNSIGKKMVLEPHENAVNDKGRQDDLPINNGTSDAPVEQNYEKDDNEEIFDDEDYIDEDDFSSSNL